MASAGQDGDKTGIVHAEAHEDPVAQTPSHAPTVQLDPATEGTYVYRTYKRRWFGLVQLALLNIIVSWDWLTYSPVVNDAATFFSTSPSTVNWLATAFMFAFGVAAPIVLYTLSRFTPKVSFVTASALLLAGNWIRYGGTRASPPSYGVVMFGQILTGLAQPFVLTAPTTYSELWYTPRGRVSATAITSLANPLGAALGQVINPAFVNGPRDIPSMTLYVAIISSLASIPSFFIPAKPPTPVAPSSSLGHAHLGMVDELKTLFSSGSFWLIFLPYCVYVGFFNSFSSLLAQILTPYGYSETESGIAGALLIFVGLAAGAVVSPVIDKSKQYLFVIRALVPIIALSYFTFIWAPTAGSIAASYVICAVVGAASFALVPVGLEALAEVTYPVRPSFSSVVTWVGGQVLGGIFIIISDALEDDEGKYGPSGNLHRALVFQGILSLVTVPCVVALGWRGGLPMLRLQFERNESGG